MTTETLEKPVTDVAVIFDNPLMSIAKPEYFEAVYAELRREADDIAVDLSTEKGRKVIAAMAFKVARTKTAIDDAGKALNDEARVKINTVDAARRTIREKLDALKGEIRKPLTDWEEAEKARAARVDTGMSWLRSAAEVAIFDSTASLQERLAEVQAFEIGADYGALAEAAEGARAHAIDILKTGIARLAKEEADRAELEKLRAEVALRAEREAAEAEVKRASEQAEAEARAAAERAAKTEAYRLAQIERAAENARVEAERAAKTERDRIATEHAVEIARRDKDAADKEAAEIAYKRNVAAEAKKIADAEAARTADRVHRGKIMGEAKAAIMSCDVSEAIAKAIVLAIVAGQIPHTAIRF